MGASLSKKLPNVIHPSNFSTTNFTIEHPSLRFGGQLSFKFDGQLFWHFLSNIHKLLKNKQTKKALSRSPKLLYQFVVRKYSKIQIKHNPTMTMNMEKNYQTNLQYENKRMNERITKKKTKKERGQVLHG